MKVITELVDPARSTGRVEWVGMATTRRKDLETPASVELVAGKGIVGEHHFGNETRPHRQVTLIQHEHLDTIARLIGKEQVDPAWTRRNIVVSGINLASFRSAEFQVGNVILQGSGDCDPCALMEQTVGPGAYAAMIYHSGITAIVKTSGIIELGAEVKLLSLADN